MYYREPLPQLVVVTIHHCRKETLASDLHPASTAMPPTLARVPTHEAFVLRPAAYHGLNRRYCATATHCLPKNLKLPKNPYLGNY
jgi:hypothetical protein